MSARSDAFLKMLERGQDSALLRFGLGNEYLLQGDADNAVIHLRQATQLDPGYSAAWKQLGKALTAAGDRLAAIAAYEAGIAAASSKGDRQAAKEMTVFLKRLQKEQRNGNA